MPIVVTYSIFWLNLKSKNQSNSEVNTLERWSLLYDIPGEKYYKQHIQLQEVYYC